MTRPYCWRTATSRAGTPPNLIRKRIRSAYRPRPPALSGVEGAAATARRAAAPKKKDPPRAIPGAGDEAFWTGDSRSGALSVYVLNDGAGVVLRISVGGVTDEEERIRRSKALAAAALRRLSQRSR